MKKNRILMMAYTAMLTIGMVSCGNGDGGVATDEWVDLGLPSGLLWYSCNLGATSPEEYGNYYAWGETTTKEIYEWSTYRYCTVDGEGDLRTLTKYNKKSDYGTIDNLISLEAADDAATQVLGNGARTPTGSEWLELIDNTTMKWTTQKHVRGWLFTAANGNTLFLPSAGLYLGGEPNFAGEFGLYWSSSLNTDYPSDAWYFYFNPGGQSMLRDGRNYGHSVRPVHSAQ